MSDAKKLFIYTGGRRKPLILTDYSASIKDISLKHKSKIQGKENSTTKFYYEVILEDNFSKNENTGFELNLNKLFPNKEDKNRKLLAQFLPALTTLDKLLSSNS